MPSATITRRPSPIAFSDNPLTYDVTVTLVPESYSLSAELYLGPDLMTKVATFPIYLDASGKASFDISRTIKAEIERSRDSIIKQLIDGSGMTAPFIPQTKWSYQIRLIESRGNPPSPDPPIIDAKNTVILGGVDQIQYPDCPLINQIGLHNNLLTFWPDYKILKYDQLDWISWYNYTGTTRAAFLKVTAYTSVQATAVGTSTIMEIEVDAHNTATWPINPSTLLSGLGGTAIVKMEIRIMDDQAAAMSDSRTYYIDNRAERSLDYIVYESIFGLPTSFALTGRKKTTLSIQRQTSIRTITDTHTSYDREIFQTSQSHDREYVYRSGYLRQAEVDALQELFIYNRGWDMSADGSDWIFHAIHIQTNKFQIDEILQHLHSAEFLALRSIRPLVYTGAALSCDNITPPVIGCPDGWETIAGDCWDSIAEGNFQVA